MRWFSPAPIFDRSRTGTRVLACLVLRPVLILVLTLVLALAACSDDDPTSPPVEDPKIVEATIGSDGGILVSGDEVLTLEVPPFAFDAPTRVSIETIIGKDPAYRIGSANPSPALGVRVSWDLGVLSAPGDDRYRHRFTWLHASSEEPVSQPAAQILRLDGKLDRVELSGELIWLDLLLTRETEDLTLGMGPVASQGLAGTLFDVEVELEQVASSRVSARPAYRDRTEALPLPQPLALVALLEEELPIVEASQALSHREAVARYRWTNVPSGRYWARLILYDPQVDGLSWDGEWAMELFLPVRGTEIPPGDEVFPSRTAFPRDLIVPRLPWGPFTDGLVVGVVGADGVPFLDAETGFLLNGDLLGLESVLGGVAMSNIDDVAMSNIDDVAMSKIDNVAMSASGPGQNDSDSFPSYLLEALFIYGSGGAGLSSWAWGMGAFTPPSPIEDGAEVVHATPYGGNPSSGGVSYAMPTLNVVGFVEPNLIGDRFERSELRVDASGFPNAPGPVISAYRKDYGGDVLVLCDGQPGALYLWASADSSVSQIGSVGDDPALLHGLNELVVVSNFGSETLTTVFWPSEGPPTIRTNLDAPGGARGVDLRFNGSERELVAGGFGSNLLLRYRLTSSGGLIESESEALPVGCAGPSDVVHLPGDIVVAAGFSSDTLARIDPPAETP